jgi:hypothetical protein
MEDEFRIPLERRIATLRGHRELLQDQLRDLHRELNSVDRRIEAAEELYRREFDTEPPETAEGSVQPRTRRIRRVRTEQLTWRDAVIRVLDDEGGPLHAREIWRRLEESGFETIANDPLRSVVATAIRMPDQITRVGPNTFALKNGKDRGRQLRVGDNGEPEPLLAEGDESQ